MIKQWNIHSDYNKDQAEYLQVNCGVNRIVAALLVQRGINTTDQVQAFFNPELSMLHDPFLMKGMSVAVERITEAISKNERILVYGDYDVDGTTAVALLYGFLVQQTSKVGYYIPDRYKEGYGISTTGIDFAEQTGCTLIIALDCGIKSVDKIEYARQKGIDFIICDHHLPGENLPNAVAVLDPKQSDCEYPYKELSGCAIGFKLAHAFCLTHEIPFSILESSLDLVAISIAADIVPITGENRILARIGLEVLNRKERHGILALIENARPEKDKDKAIGIHEIVFVIAPRINAAGRIDHGSKAVRLLVSTNYTEAIQIASEVNQNNSDRRDLDTDITREALEMMRQTEEFALRKSTVLFNDKWHKGVVGIVASRMTEHYYRPTIILTESNGMVVGSARSVKDFDVYTAIEQCGDLLEQFGGHKFAAGLTLKKENFESFSARFEKVVSSSITDDQLIPREEIDLEINFNEISFSLLDSLKKFAPHGPGNMTPVFCTSNVFDTGYAKIVGNNHLKLELYQENNYFNKVNAIAFGMGDFLNFFQQKRPIKICYTLNENFFNNRKTLQLNIRNIQLM
jgi:single-stranded-DNA-specific exonuclease